MKSTQLKNPMLAGIALLASAISVTASAPAAAQGVYTAPAPYREDPGAALSRHLRTLAESPRSLAALTGAAKAALDLGDAQSAATFYARAEEIAPRDGRVKAGLGAAFLAMEQPDAALKFFEDARVLGVPEAEFAGDRGLIYDLQGNTSLAQRDYQLALRSGENDEVRRRLALSLAISGDRAGALAAIEPQLRQQDRAAWRVRAFILALTGDAAGAVDAVRIVMPAQAAAMQPFLARLPLLGPADRAAAVHFGRFPEGVLQLAEAPPQPLVTTAPAATAGTPATSAKRPTTTAGRKAAAPSTTSRKTSKSSSSGLTWAEERALLRGSGVARRSKPNTQPQPQAAMKPAQPVTVSPAPAQQIAQANPYPITPPIISVPTPAPYQAPQLANASPTVTTPAYVPPSASTTTVPVQGPPAGASPPVAVQSTAVPQSNLTADLSASTPPAPAPVEPSVSPSSSAGGSALADIAATIRALPGGEDEADEAPAKPVRLAEAATAKKTPAAAKTAKAEPAKKEPAAAGKSGPRYWVQLASASDAAALGEYKRLKAKAPKLLGTTTGWKTSFRSTNRVLVGPFKDQKEAQALVNALAKADIDAVPWTSEAGQEIVKLAAK